jgi:hypothetical protein
MEPVHLSRGGARATCTGPLPAWIRARRCRCALQRRPLNQRTSRPTVARAAACALALHSRGLPPIQRGRCPGRSCCCPFCSAACAPPAPPHCAAPLVLATPSALVLSLLHRPPRPLCMRSSPPVSAPPAAAVVRASAARGPCRRGQPRLRDPLDRAPPPASISLHAGRLRLPSPPNQPSKMEHVSGARGRGRGTGQTLLGFGILGRQMAGRGWARLGQLRQRVRQRAAAGPIRRLQSSVN